MDKKVIKDPVCKCGAALKYSHDTNPGEGFYKCTKCDLTSIHRKLDFGSYRKVIAQREKVKE